MAKVRWKIYGRKIISHLVETLGFRTTVLEESYGYCLRVNSYILNGEGTAEKVYKF
jgi:erythromycin esterase-like protein